MLNSLSICVLFRSILSGSPCAVTNRRLKFPADMGLGIFQFNKVAVSMRTFRSLSPAEVHLVRAFFSNDDPTSKLFQSS